MTESQDVDEDTSPLVTSSLRRLSENAQGSGKVNRGKTSRPPALCRRDLNGKIALVTAASRGLGRGCAEQLAAEKCRVAICSRDLAGAKQAAEEISAQTGSEVLGFGADVSKAEDVGRLLEEVRQSLGDPEILVTNAGGPAPGTFASTALAEYQKALNLNLMSAVHLIHGVTPVMKSRG